MAEHVRLLVRAGIPVVGHVGLTPQSLHVLGGFKVQGRGAAAKRILDDAKALEEAGAFCIVLEAIPPDVAQEVTQELSIPTIGIGAGPHCDGQVLVCSDLLGMGRGKSPRFVKRYANIGDDIVRAVATYADEVRAAQFPDESHSYRPNVPTPEESRPALREAPHTESDPKLSEEDGAIHANGEDSEAGGDPALRPKEEGRILRLLVGA
jgi:3-methyl-2-oxobutanoate hydroxymethyltransferase